MTTQTCLAPIPAAGRGVHQWVASSAAKLIVRGMSAADVEATLLPIVTTQRSEGTALREIRAAVSSAQRKFTPVARGMMRIWSPPPAVTPLHRIPVDWQSVRSIVFAGGDPGLDYDRPRDPGGLLTALFGDDEWICASPRDARLAATKRRDEWLAEAQNLELVVPSPMTGPIGLNQEGKITFRSLANTAPRRYLVIEFDFKADATGEPVTDCGRFVADLESRGITVRDACAALHAHLAQLAPLVLVAWSGGKSLHAWFRTAGREDDAEKLMRYACTLGADDATWPRCQMVRFPDGYRHDRGVRQTCCYFNRGNLAPKQ